MEVRTRVQEVIQFSLMVLVEGCTVGLTITTKIAMAEGMSQFVFVVYSNALSSAILLPEAFIFHRTQQSFFTFPLLTRIFFLGLTGITIAQTFGLSGLRYTTPILVCGIGNLTPAFSFLLSLILRKTKTDWRDISGKAKIIGTMISIGAGSMMILYTGPIVRKTSLFNFSSTPGEWALGGILLVVATLSACIWSLIQEGTVIQYPEPVTIAALHSSTGTFQSAVVAFTAERKLNAWKLKLNLELLLIFLSAIFGSVIRGRVHMWCMQNKGPSYVPLFRPFGIIFASVTGAILFGSSLHYGSVIGAFIIGIGYYTILWGQSKEGEARSKGMDSSNEKVPLLLGEEEQA